MTLPGPLIIIGAPLAMAVVLLLLRRWTTLSAWLAALTAGLMGLLVATAPLKTAMQLGNFQFALGRPLIILGRELIVRNVDAPAIAFLFFTTAGLFILAWRLLPHSNFFPVGLATVALLSGALMVSQVVYAALFIEIAAIFAVFPLHEGRTRAQGGLRFMAYTTLALPGLMVTQLLLDLFTIFPNDVGLLSTSAALLSVSFIILMGAVPFQAWLSAVTDDGSPPVVTFIFTVNQGAVWFMLLDYLQTYTWLSGQGAFGPFITAAGILMMTLGGLLAASQRKLGRLVGYATLVDNGALLLALGTHQTAGIALAALLLMARPFSLGLMTLGLAGLRQLGNGADTREALAGAAWRAPWRTAAFLVGGIALAGFPLSLGFAARWGLYRLVAEITVSQAIAALAGSAGVMLGLVFTMRSLFVPPLRDEDAPPPPPFTEDRVVIVLIAVLMAIVLSLGLFPQLLSRVALQMAQGYTFFGP